MIITHILLEKYISSSKGVNFEGVVELVLPNARSGRSVMSNGKRPRDRK